MQPSNKKEQKVSISKEKFSIVKHFKFENLKATWKKEIIGGLSTFLALVYILNVQSDIMNGTTSIFKGVFPDDYIPKGSIYLLTCIVIGVCTILMGLISNLPVVAAPGMGLNTMFAFSIASNSELGYEGGMIATMISSILFTIFSWTKLRQLISQAIPEVIHIGIGVGLGFFIAYVGLQNMGWVPMKDGHAIAQMGDLKTMYISITLGMVSLFCMLLLQYKKIPGAVAIPMIVGMIISIFVVQFGPSNSSLISNNFSDTKITFDSNSYKEFGQVGDVLGNVFKSFAKPQIWESPTLYVGSFIFLLVSIFDTNGVLTICSVGISEKADYRQLVISRGLKTVSVFSIGASMVGISPTIVTLESNVGINQGGKTGITAVIMGLCFLLMIPLYPIMRAMPKYEIGAASLFIGIMMGSHLKDIHFNEPRILVPVFMIIIFMVVTQDITNGVAMGIISYTLVSLMFGKVKEISPTLWVLTFLFIAYFILHGFIN